MNDSPLPVLPPAWERRKLRDAMGITRVRAAREIGVSERTYFRWEQGADPSPGNLRKYHEQLTRWEAVQR